MSALHRASTQNAFSHSWQIHSFRLLLTLGRGNENGEILMLLEKVKVVFLAHSGDDFFLCPDDRFWLMKRMHLGNDVTRGRGKDESKNG